MRIDQMLVTCASAAVSSWADKFLNSSLCEAKCRIIRCNTNMVIIKQWRRRRKSYNRFHRSAALESTSCAPRCDACSLMYNNVIQSSAAVCSLTRNIRHRRGRSHAKTVINNHSHVLTILLFWKSLQPRHVKQSNRNSQSRKCVSHYYHSVDFVFLPLYLRICRVYDDK